VRSGLHALTTPSWRLSLAPPAPSGGGISPGSPGGGRGGEKEAGDAWRRDEAVGLCWALGLALFTVLSFLLYLAHWTGVGAILAALTGTLVVAAFGARALAMARRTDSGLASDASDAGESANGAVRDWREALIVAAGLGLAIVQVAYSGLLAARAPFAAWDAWSFWALKARMFALGGPRLGYFHDPLTLYTHPDYPLNLPLAAAALFRIHGQIGVVLAALIGPACLGALLLLLYGGLTRLYGRATAALAVGALSFVPALPIQAASGNADAPLTMYIGAATLYLLLWWRLRRPADGLLMGLLAGGAIWTKREGLPLAALLIVAYIVGEFLRARASRRARELPALSDSSRAWRFARLRRIRQLAGVSVAVVSVPLPWLLFSLVVRPLGRDFLPFTPSVFLAHADRLPHIVTLFLLQMLDFANWGLLWLLLAVLLLMAARRLPPHGRGLLLLLLGQLCVYMVSFVFSDWQPYTAHIQTSLDRLLLQAVPLALLLLVDVAYTVGTGRARLDKAVTTTVSDASEAAA
jgi:hypothetical protein